VPESARIWVDDSVVGPDKPASCVVVSELAVIASRFVVVRASTVVAESTPTSAGVKSAICVVLIFDSVVIEKGTTIALAAEVKFASIAPNWAPEKADSCVEVNKDSCVAVMLPIVVTDRSDNCVVGIKFAVRASRFVTERLLIWVVESPPSCVAVKAAAWVAVRALSVVDDRFPICVADRFAISAVFTLVNVVDVIPLSWVAVRAVI